MKFLSNAMIAALSLSFLLTSGCFFSHTEKVTPVPAVGTTGATESSTTTTTTGGDGVTEKHTTTTYGTP